MVSIFKQFTDKTLEEAGVPVYVSEYDCTLKVARVGNKRHSTLNERVMKPYQKYFKSGDLAKIPEDKLEEIKQATVRVYAETILLGWNGIFGDDDKPLPYSVDNAILVLADDDFFGIVKEIAGEKETFRKRELEDNLKNSKKASSGN